MPCLFLLANFQYFVCTQCPAFPNQSNFFLLNRLLGMSSKRSYAVHKSPSSEGFIEQMKATKSLTELQDLISTKDHATLACAFDSLLRQVSEGPSGEEARKKLKVRTFI